jgi:hypothetical protein
MQTARKPPCRRLANPSNPSYHKPPIPPTRFAAAALTLRSPQIAHARNPHHIAHQFPARPRQTCEGQRLRRTVKISSFVRHACLLARLSLRRTSAAGPIDTAAAPCARSIQHDRRKCVAPIILFGAPALETAAASDAYATALHGRTQHRPQCCWLTRPAPSNAHQCQRHDSARVVQRDCRLAAVMAKPSR